MPTLDRLPKTQSIRLKKTYGFNSYSRCNSKRLHRKFKKPNDSRYSIDLRYRNSTTSKKRIFRLLKAKFQMQKLRDWCPLRTALLFHNLMSFPNCLKLPSLRVSLLELQAEPALTSITRQWPLALEKSRLTSTTMKSLAKILEEAKTLDNDRKVWKWTMKFWRKVKITSKKSVNHHNFWPFSKLLWLEPTQSSDTCSNS